MNSMQWKDLVPRSVCEGGKGWRGSHLEQEEMKEGNKKDQNRKQLCFSALKHKKKLRQS